MFKSKSLLAFFSGLETITPWFILAGLLFSAYATFAAVPYAGFAYSGSGQIVRIHVPTAGAATLKVGDRLVQVGTVPWSAFTQDLRQSFFEGVQPGEIVPITVERNGQIHNINWRFPGPTNNEIWDRLYSQWPLAFVFWAAGAFTFLFIRPKNGLWRLFLAFYFITASWLSIGGFLSGRHIGDTALLLRILVWLSVPIYWHLHWVLFKTPQTFFHKGWLPFYGASIILAGLAWFQILPSNTLTVAIALAFGGSLVAVVIQGFRQPQQRREIARLVVIWASAALPPLIISVVVALLPVTGLEGGAFLLLPIAPIAYLYTAYRQQLGVHEVRANRLIALYLFIILVSSLLALLSSLVTLLVPQNHLFLDFLITLSFIVIAALGFPNFQQFIERWFLHVPWSQNRIVETYLERIVTTLDTTQLAHLLQVELLPTLLIRQSALLRHTSGQFTQVYLQNITPAQLPAGRDLPLLLAQAGQYRNPTPTTQPLAWPRLILPLKIGNEVIGLWLLGRHDPDDFYAQTEIQTLQSVAHQTAIALSNISNAERLRYLYQNTIDQDEAARAYLGRELHDHTLQELFSLRQNVMTHPVPPEFDEKYKAVTESLRRIIRGLRPPMLEYGLYHAFAALVDEWENRPKPVRIHFEVLASEARYPQKVEEYIYRILQQAGENAQKHAQATELTLRGQLDPHAIQLSLLDNGQGFDVQQQLRLSQIATGHFGLVNMQERAVLIQAQFHIDSSPGRGTQIHLRWQPTA